MKGCNFWKDIKSFIFWKQTVVSLRGACRIRCHPSPGAGTSAVALPPPRPLRLSVSLTSGACFCPETLRGFPLPGAPSFITHCRSPPSIFQARGFPASACRVRESRALCFPLCLSWLSQGHDFSCADSSWISTSRLQRPPSLLHWILASETHFTSALGSLPCFSDPAC